MKNMLLKSFTYCFVYYAILQLLVTISYIFKYYSIVNLYNLDIFVKIIYFAMLFMGILTPFIVFRKSTIKDLSNNIKIILKKHWLKYGFLTLLVLELGANSICSGGVLSHLLANDTVLVNDSLAVHFMVRYVYELFLSELALVFFIFAPFICHIAMCVREHNPRT